MTSSATIQKIESLIAELKDYAEKGPLGSKERSYGILKKKIRSATRSDLERLKLSAQTLCFFAQEKTATDPLLACASLVKESKARVLASDLTNKTKDEALLAVTASLSFALAEMSERAPAYSANYHFSHSVFDLLGGLRKNGLWQNCLNDMKDAASREQAVETMLVVSGSAPNLRGKILHFAINDVLEARKSLGTAGQNKRLKYLMKFTGPSREAEKRIIGLLRKNGLDR